MLTKLNFCIQKCLFWKFFFWVRNSICTWQKNFMQFRNYFIVENVYSCYQKSASHTVSIYGLAFSRQKSYTPKNYDTPTFMPKQVKWLRKFDETILAKLMNFVWLVFFIDFEKKKLVLTFLKCFFKVCGKSPNFNIFFFNFAKLNKHLQAVFCIKKKQFIFTLIKRK